MLLALMGGVFFVKHEFAKDKQEKLADKPDTRKSSQ